MRTNAATALLFVGIAVFPTVSAHAETHEDAIHWLALNIYHEARGEGIEGQLAAGRVVMNRVKSPDYPNTVKGVVTDGTERGARCDFSWYCDGKPDTPTDRDAFAIASVVASAVLDGYETAIPACAHSYHAAQIPQNGYFLRLAPVIRIGAHVFYCDKQKDPLVS